ncbi:MAG: hypothetical protein AB1898_10740 [Acidobacteriota bacterium]
MKKQESSLTRMQWVGVALVLASLGSLILIGAFITRIRHVVRRHPTMAAGYDFSWEWSSIVGAAMLGLISLLLGRYLYRRGKRLRRLARSRRTSQRAS